jgi:hypothetical protein
MRASDMDTWIPGEQLSLVPTMEYVTRSASAFERLVLAALPAL